MVHLNISISVCLVLILPVPTFSAAYNTDHKNLIDMNYNIKMIHLLLIICIGLRQIACEDYCTFETFNPTCQTDEALVMTEAKYGQMELGRCIESDIGYLGCQGDVLFILDNKCSGRTACNVRVASTELSSRSSCAKVLLQYLSVSYICRKALQILPHDCHNGNIKLEDKNVIMSNTLIQECLPINTAVKITAKPGQHINISLIDMHDSQDDTFLQSTYGKVKDVKSNYEKQFGSGKRYQPLIETTGNEVELTITTNAKLFTIEFDVQGCANMQPPDGAWMTRDGDVMEIGCHSGKHVWRLRCEDGQWMGAVGYCGTVIEENIPDIAVKASSSEVSKNIIVFGICSLVILVSSIVFLVGVLLLKRHNTVKYGYYTYQSGAPTLVPVSNEIMAFESLSRVSTNDTHCGKEENLMYKSQDYKSLQIK